MTIVELAVIAAEAIGNIGRAVLDAKEGRITPDEALARMHGAVRGPRKIDARVDAVLDAKFPRPSTVAEALAEDDEP